MGIYDLKGREVAVLVDEALPAGNHIARWDGRDDGGRESPSGIYFVRLAIHDQQTTRKITLAR